jgi:hypothetical protein
MLHSVPSDSSTDELPLAARHAVLCCAHNHRFVKLCKAAAKGRDGVEDAPPIVFLKHNVYDDEEEEVTDLAKKYNVRVSFC